MSKNLALSLICLDEFFLPLSRKREEGNYEESSPRQTLCLAHLSLGERMEDFGTQVSSRSIFNLGDKVPKCPLSASWKEGSVMLKYSELRSPKVSRLWSSSLTWKAMWPLCSTCSEQLMSRDMASWLRKSFLPQRSESPQLHPLGRNSSKLWGGREGQWSRINTPVACLFLRKEMGFGDEFYYSASRSLCFKRWEQRTLT